MFRGRALLAPCLLTAFWILARSATFQDSVQDFGHEARILDAATNGPTAKSNIRTNRSELKFTAWPKDKTRAAGVIFGNPVSKIFADLPQFEAGPAQHYKRSPPAVGVSIFSALESARNHQQSESQLPTADQQNYKPQPGKGATETTPAPGHSASRLSLYGYAFWRDDGNQGLAPFAQYGGSQHGLIASYRLGDSKTAPALFGRISGALDSLRNAEAATGVRWQPSHKLPLSLAVERRFRRDAADAIAAYLFGGWSSDQMPFGAQLSVYGQAGAVRADSGPEKLDHFYDGQVRLERKALTIGKANLSVGGGAWAGGQSGINRVDAGPTAAINFGLGQTSFQLSADYRFRVTGNAAPASGPAITLSASY